MPLVPRGLYADCDTTWSLGDEEAGSVSSRLVGGEMVREKVPSGWTKRQVSLVRVSCV